MTDHGPQKQPSSAAKIEAERKQLLMYSPCSGQLGDKPIGTTHWSGKYQGRPAFLVSYHGGSSLWHFRDGLWMQQRFASLQQAFEILGFK